MATILDLNPENGETEKTQHRLIKTKTYCALRDCSPVTIWRDLKRDETHPRPISINGMNFFWLDEILGWLKARPRG